MDDEKTGAEKIKPEEEQEKELIEEKENINYEKSAAFADEIPAKKEKKNMAFDTSSSSFSTQSGSKKNRNKVVIAIIAVVVLIAGFLLYRNIAGRQTETDTVETSKPTKAPTPTPELSKEDIKIQVLNGTGTEGEATKVSDILTDAGFVDIETDNADSYDNTTTTISAKSSALEFAEEIKEALSEEFDSVTVDEDLDEESEFDIVITTGREKTEEEETTPTPTGTDTTETPTPTPSPTP